MRQSPLLLVFLLVLSINVFGQGTCGDPDGNFFDDPDACSCVDFSCGGDCLSCFMSVCLDCPCTFPDDYTDANGDGMCLNNLSQGTYCFVMTWPSSGMAFVSLTTHDCAGCNQLTGVGSYYDDSDSQAHPCGAETFDKDCNSLGSGLKTGTGTAGINAGDIITYCVTVPAGCDGTMDICPVARCNDETDCGQSTSGLPIEIIYVKTYREIEQVTLSWETASETNNHFFTIERRAEHQQDFHFLATVKGMGNSSIGTKYTYRDNSPYPGKYYFRLTQTDYDGTNAYVGMGMVETSENIDRMVLVSLFPIPATTKLNYELHMPNTGMIQVEVFNATGERVLMIQDEGKEGMNGNTVDITGLSKGIYMLKIANETDVVVEQFIVL